MTNMAEARVICPGCKSRFTVKAPSLDVLNAKPFRCPKCGTAAPFNQVIAPAGPPPLHTHIGGAPGMFPPIDGKTRMAGAAGAVVTLSVDSTGRNFPLGPGVYTLGRDSADSRASLKISPDRYMSRLQASLEVTPGGCRISGLSATNPIFVNSTRLEAGMSAPLKNGDKILLGMTNVAVKM